MSAIDPVCGQEVDTLRARAVAIVDGKTHYFCSAAHKEQFLREHGRRPTPAPIPVEKPAATASPSPVAQGAVSEKLERPIEAARPSPAAASPPAASRPATVPMVEEEPPGEVRITPPRRAGPLRYVVAVLVLAAIAVAVAVLSHRGG